ncbi:DHA2 family efflux MFS transporter permease subunit [Mycobacterium heckeshornense]|uniref:Multidrug resistance protein B n=1 Tax=Mycobacterium heckeshornense TaxID=110505 RepID=A0A2I3F2C9_9MYCO|nr:DHA2 family efflux MFS transporter permease subunit [Mycobacterium heckeshornense]KMV24277.1 major facilitator transporter [Mycobacterium heckeshornense]BCO34157.1 multidrug resistance protein B [Mycobacterium heckeshornense]
MPNRQPTTGERTDPDKLDAGLLRTAGVCAMAVVMAILDTTVVGVAQRTFITEFHSTQAVVAWTMTGYTLALATVIPLAGWAADRFGTKRLFIGSVLAFTLGSLLCAMAPNVAMLITFRVLQGLGGGMLMPLTVTILTREAGPARIGRLMALLGIPMMLGPIAGPILGGWLIDAYSWEWIFRINLPIGVSAVVLAALTFPRDRTTPSETFDFVGMLLLSPGVAAFLYGVSSLPAYGTIAEPHVWVPVAAGLALIGGFVRHALGTDNPLIDLRLFTNSEVTTANSTLLLFAAAFFGAVLLIPSCFQQLLQQTALQSGLHMMPERLGALLTMPIAGILLDKRGPSKVVLAGITLIGAGMATFAYGVATHAGYLPVLLAALLLMGMGLGCTTMPLVAAAVQSLAPHQIARGSALVHVNLQIAASISTAVMSVLLTSQLDHSKEHAYTTVFVVAAVLAVLAYIPAAFLPKKPVTAAPGLPPMVTP